MKEIEYKKTLIDLEYQLRRAKSDWRHSLFINILWTLPGLICFCLIGLSIWFVILFNTAWLFGILGGLFGLAIWAAAMADIGGYKRLNSWSIHDIERQIEQHKLYENSIDYEL